MSEIRIVAELEVLPQHREELMPVLQALVDGSRGEAGNIAYDLTEDLSNVCHFFVIETWASQQAIDEHNATPRGPRGAGGTRSPCERRAGNRGRRATRRSRCPCRG